MFFKASSTIINFTSHTLNLGVLKGLFLLYAVLWHLDRSMVNLMWCMQWGSSVELLRCIRFCCLIFVRHNDIYWLVNCVKLYPTVHLWEGKCVCVCVMSTDMTVSPDWTHLMLCQPDCLCLPSGLSMKINDPWVATAFCTKWPQVNKNLMSIPKGR